MSNKIKPKRRYTSGSPTVSDLEEGEIGINFNEKKIYGRDNSNNIVELANGNSIVPSDYASATIGGTVKIRLDGTSLYITTDGSDA